MGNQKAIDTLKSTPIWLLIGLFLTIVLVWLVPGFHSLVPDTAAPFVPLAMVVTSILLACKLAALIASKIFQRRHIRAEQDRERLVNLYRPLAMLFLTRHVTNSTGVNAPRLRHRFANARIALSSYRRPTVVLRRGLQALFDRQSSTSAEIEYGGDFPLSQIVNLTRGNPEHADAALLNLINSADRSRYEDRGNGGLTDAEYTMFEYIIARHDRFSRRFG